jgi:hypothetical protein
VLRIDETSKTLVAPQAGGLVTEASPDRDELLALAAAALAALHEALSAAVPGESPQLVIVAGAFDQRALDTAGWLSRRHGVEISTFVVSLMRFGSERLLSVRREPRDGHAADPAAEVQWMLTGDAPAAPVAPPVPAGASTPPPGK